MTEQITAVIIAFDEAIHIERCIQRLRPITNRIVVVDSHSTDGTVEIAQNLGADVLQNPFTSHAAQFQWAMEHSGITEGWILRMDADEYLEIELAREIRDRLGSLSPDVTAVEFRRKVFFQGKWIRWGGYYPVVLTRLWRVGAARVEQRLMDEHVVVEFGQTVLFRRGDLVDDNKKDITFWTEKHNNYTTRQMVEFLCLEHRSLCSGDGHPGKLNRRARMKRHLRNGLYARSPLYVRAVAYFLARYFLQLGFLDGKRGFIFHTLQGFWNFFLVDVKIGEARKYISANGVESFRRHLASRHGLRVGSSNALSSDAASAHHQEGLG